ncbi:HIT family protein [Mumia sp. Pv 4-285]|uniref:HIT family protein n=1 Tax=Mumia qirimensis TaxID=3234852 RepID=UPI00351D1BC6
MTQAPEAVRDGCIFCAIVAQRAEASMVYEDDITVVFMDINPATPGHLLVVPRRHAVGLEDLDGETSVHVWSVGHQMARAVRRSGLRCDGINLFVADGTVAFQEVLHFHLHVIPRFAGDGFVIQADWKARDRLLLDADAEALRGALLRGTD